MTSTGSTDDLGVGTVITFTDPTDPTGTVTHRIDSIDDLGEYVTRGDANSDADGRQVPPDQIVGVGRLLIPAVGLPSVWVSRGDLHLLALWLIVSVAAVWVAFSRRGRWSAREIDSGAADPEPSAAVPVADLARVGS